MSVPTEKSTTKRHKEPQKITLENLASCDHALDADAVADIFNIHPLTVYRYAREKRLPSFKICGCLRFDPRALAKHIGEVR